MRRATQVVGRDNGDVEIYAFDPTLTSPLKLLYKKAMNECITSVEAGFITDTTLEDVVLATYSGKVVALSQSTEDGQNIGVGTESLPGDKQLKKLQREIDGLQSRMLRYTRQTWNPLALFESTCTSPNALERLAGFRARFPKLLTVFWLECSSFVTC